MCSRGFDARHLRAALDCSHRRQPSPRPARKRDRAESEAHRLSPLTLRRERELFRQAGVIRTATLEEMFDVAALLANQPVPKGNRVAIVTNAGGPGILGNPVDRIASATANQYRDTLDAVLGGRMTGAVVQAMAADGVEMMAGVTHDPVFGKVMAMGAGGTLVELLNDVAFRLHPLTTRDPEAMLHELRCEKLLRGFRGSKPVDVAGLGNVILREVMSAPTSSRRVAY